MRTSLNVLAERFVKDQLRIMKKHGKEPRLEAGEYKQLLVDTERTFRGLAGPIKTTTQVKSHGRLGGRAQRG